MIKAADNYRRRVAKIEVRLLAQQYVTWQAELVSYRHRRVAEELPDYFGRKELSPQLKSDSSHFADYRTTEDVF